MPLYPLVRKKVGHSHKFQQGKDVGDEETKLEIILTRKCLQYLRDYKLKEKAILDVEDDKGGY